MSLPKLRIPLGTVSITTTRTPATRRVWCPSCDYEFQASGRAMTLRCPVCTHGLRLGDLILTQSIHGAVTVIGQVTIPRSMALSGSLVCVELVNDGAFDGQARTGGAIELRPGSYTRGSLTGRTLQVHAGAAVRAQATIGGR